jgi:membrane protein
MHQVWETVIRLYRIVMDAVWRFLGNDNWAIASDIALATLMSLFPFLIIVTAAASLIGDERLAKEVADLILASWPPQVGERLAAEVLRVLTGEHRDFLTLGSVLAIYFSSSAVQSVRIGLNRAYGVIETRSWVLTRLESIGFVILGVFVLMSLALLIILGPVIYRTVVAYVPEVAEFAGTITALRFAIASIVIIVALTIAHYWLPSGWRRLKDIWPGILITLAGWIGTGVGFGWYLDDFGSNYVYTYAGLATGMIALAFLYFSAAIFLFGGEFNAAIMRARRARASDAASEWVSAI